MALNKCNLGEHIELCNSINSDLLFGLHDVRGVNNLKSLMPTKADMNGRDLSKFQIVNSGEFVFNHRTSRNGSKFSIAFNDGESPVICTEDYVVFRIKQESKNILSAKWLYMFFNRSEFDRYVITNSWGSSTEFYNWEDICALELELPDLPTQQKYVDIYNAMVANQQSYERALEDLKFTCDVYIEDLRRKMPIEEIGKYLLCTDRKTDDTSLEIRGISNQQKLISSDTRTQGVEKEKYLRIDSREFGYSPIHINDGSIAFNDSNSSFLLSPIYKTFKVVDEEKLFSEYLMMWFARSEFTRYCWFYAFGSARDNFEWEQMCEVKIPIPSITIQKSIADIYKCYIARKDNNERLKTQIKDICPILIKGSLEEGAKK